VTEKPALYCGDGRYPDSYYAATRYDESCGAPLQQSIDTDVCVVGGGFTGLSTALFLQQQGYQVTLLEGGQIGWGASGRNGGQIINGISGGFAAYQKLFPEYSADAIGELFLEGRNIVFDFVERFAIDCHLRSGMLTVAHSKRAVQGLESEAQQWAQHGVKLELLNREELGQHVGSVAYHGGLLDPLGGHFHPLNFIRGEARALENLGGIIYEQTPVLELHTDGARPWVRTAQGEVRARKLVLAANAYIGELSPRLASRILPTGTQMLATEPLGEDVINRLLPSNHCVCDTRYVVEYFRRTPDNRLLYGGGITYGGASPGDIEAYLRKGMHRAFPELQAARVDYTWAGNIGITANRMPGVGMLGEHTYFSHGYSGHGVNVTHLYGKVLAEAISGDRSRFDSLSKARSLPFPGGKWLRAPYQAAGAGWYGLRDRLGI
jgi:gamma-glutamylputrescine oxidase